MLRTFTTFVIFFIPLLVFPQISELEKLKRDKIEIQGQITIFQDSLAQITKRIETLKTEDIPFKTAIEPVGKVMAKVALEKSKSHAKTSFELRTAPHGLGEVIMKVKKGAPIQQIDILGDYHLICVTGNCGYVHRKFIEQAETGNKRLVQQEEKEQQEPDGSSLNIITQ